MKLTWNLSRSTGGEIPGVALVPAQPDPDDFAGIGHPEIQRAAGGRIEERCTPQGRRKGADEWYG